MNVKQLIMKLNSFDEDAVVTIGDGTGWSNVETVVKDGSCVKITMSDNVVFSDDRIEVEKSCRNCTGDGAQWWYPSQCTGCGNDGEYLNWERK